MQQTLWELWDTAAACQARSDEAWLFAQFLSGALPLGHLSFFLLVRTLATDASAAYRTQHTETRTRRGLIALPLARSIAALFFAFVSDSTWTSLTDALQKAAEESTEQSAHVQELLRPLRSRSDSHIRTNTATHNEAQTLNNTQTENTQARLPTPVQAILNSDVAPHILQSPGSSQRMLPSLLQQSRNATPRSAGQQIRPASNVTSPGAPVTLGTSAETPLPSLSHAGTRPPSSPLPQRILQSTQTRTHTSEDTRTDTPDELSTHTLTRTRHTGSTDTLFLPLARFLRLLLRVYAEQHQRFLSHVAMLFSAACVDPSLSPSEPRLGAAEFAAVVLQTVPQLTRDESAALFASAARHAQQTTVSASDFAFVEGEYELFRKNVCGYAGQGGSFAAVVQNFTAPFEQSTAHTESTDAAHALRMLQGTPGPLYARLAAQELQTQQTYTRTNAPLQRRVEEMRTLQHLARTTATPTDTHTAHADTLPILSGTRAPGLSTHTRVNTHSRTAELSAAPANEDTQITTLSVAANSHTPSFLTAPRTPNTQPPSFSQNQACSLIASLLLVRWTEIQEYVETHSLPLLMKLRPKLTTTLTPPLQSLIDKIQTSLTRPPSQSSESNQSIWCITIINQIRNFYSVLTDVQGKVQESLAVPSATQESFASRIMNDVLIHVDDELTALHTSIVTREQYFWAAIG